MKWLLPALLALALALTGCSDGDGTEGALESAEEHLLDAESGTFEIELSGEREGEAVGFSAEGAFSYEQGEYPLVDVAYERRRGTEETSNRFQSDGTSAWLVEGALVTPVSMQDLQGLRAREGVAAMVPDLHVASWFDDAERDGDVIRGTVDIAAAFGDLRMLAAEIDGNRGDPDVEDAAAERLRDALRDASIELRLGEDDRFRALTLRLDFGDEIPEDVDRGLASYAAPELELRMSLEPLDGPLEVRRPGATGS